MLRKYWEKESSKIIARNGKQSPVGMYCERNCFNKKHLTGSANTAGIEMDLSFALPVSVSWHSDKLRKYINIKFIKKQQNPQLNEHIFQQIEILTFLKCKLTH